MQKYQQNPIFGTVKEFKRPNKLYLENQESDFPWWIFNWDNVQQKQ